MEDKQKPHIIIVAPPFQGHLNPLIQLTLKLASKGFTITFVNTLHIHHKILKTRKHLDPEDNDNLFSGSGLDIRYRTISDGFPLSFDRSLHREQFREGRLHVFPAHVDDLVGQLMGSGPGSDPRPTCLVADTFYTWASTIAEKYGLVNVSFWTQPALVLTLYYHMDLLKDNGHYGSKDNRNDNIDYIPGVKALDPTDLISFLRETDTSNVMHRMIHKAFTDVRKADFILCNTVQELEPTPLSAMNTIMQPIYAIGPLLPAQFTNRAVEMNLWSESDCTKWLDNKPHGSVLYVSFGSYVNSDKEDIKIIADGLMLSGVHFIWVLRPDIVSSNVNDILPEGFLENVKNKGLIVPWCNQNVVLSHSAVGGFLTHCGWNSILESIWCEVPLICFPFEGDQMTNRKLVVDDWKIGINLCEGKLGSSNEIGERIKFLMSVESSHELRKAIEDVRKKVYNALFNNGSSQRNFDKFVEDVKAKIECNRNEKKFDRSA